jgi:hypothetical protein
MIDSQTEYGEIGLANYSARSDSDRRGEIEIPSSNTMAIFSIT